MSPQGARVERVYQSKKTQQYNFCSNDYLGLAAHPKILAALQAGAERWGVGSGASHLVCGHSYAHQALEEAIAAWLQRPAVLSFSSGFSANLALLQTLLTSDDLVLEDKLNHASLLDGARISGAKVLRYRHLDVAHLQMRLQQATHQAKASNVTWVVTDGVFSMDGDQADLEAYSQLCQVANAHLIVDEAHSLGVLGTRGQGLAADVTSAQTPIIMGTLGKALGTSGAFVAASTHVIEYLRQFARPYIYTTASSPALAWATCASVHLVQSEEGAELRAQLVRNIQDFRQGVQALGLPLAASTTSIQILPIADVNTCLRWSQILAQAGVWVAAIRPPTVAQARLRITLSAAHTQEQIHWLLQALARCQQLYPLSIGDV
ncbi:8-amino-7-oxononanoate synthase [Allopseudospirillum japonicum]|uniref:8-amino-7-oxononanoate synthase n=1 Tax=Allopseudospirillum japonicum TaxID=64971 RepID=A0A1H6QAZ2_9GAMM|nr:8-amino-7-oxononanoate synthase [Allopseudospirillum japonicum]SEI40961.1 8-amino-7-oxononanoate synthase [Allopseudospirillum japonicum]